MIIKRLNKSHYSQGIATLALVLFVSVVLVFTIITLQTLALLNVNIANKNLSQQQVYYSTESAMYSTMMKMAESKLTWPNGNNYTDSIKGINEVDIDRHITLNNNKYTINLVGKNRHFSRQLSAQIDISTFSDFQMDLILVLDTSGSMSDGGPEPCDGSHQPKCQPMDDTREAAKAIVDLVANQNNEARIAVYGFNTTASRKIALTNDYQAVKNAIDDLKNTGGTNIGDGFIKANNEFTQNGKENTLEYVILLSDGVSNYYRDEQGNNKACSLLWPEEHNECTTRYTPGGAIYQSKMLQQNIDTIYTIGLNISSMNPTTGNCADGNCDIDKVINIARETLIRSATKPENYFEAPSSDELEGIFSEIFYRINEGPVLNIFEMPPQ